MRVSEFRCYGSEVIEGFGVPWFVNSLVVSQRRSGFRWGLCVVCGRRHYDRVRSVILFN